MNIEPNVAVEAASAAIVVQSESNSSPDHTKPSDPTVAHACANCGAKLNGHYCHECGQSSHIHRSLLHLVEELLHGLFHFDTKAWRTISALFRRPGTMTREYIHGHRIRYVSPLALLLFLQFLTFFMFAVGTAPSGSKPDDAVKVATAAMYEKVEELKTALKAKEAVRYKIDPNDHLALEKNAKEIQELGEKIQQISDEVSEEITSGIKSVSDITVDLGGSGKANNSSTPSSATDLSSASSVSASKSNGTNTTQKSNESTVAVTTDGSLISILRTLQANVKSSPPNSQSAWLNNAVIHAVENPELTVYKFKSNAGKYAFLLAPLSLPFIWLVFAWKRRFKMFDHAVFTLYSLSFAACALIIASLLNMVGWGGWGVAFVFCVIPIHIFAQLRGTYELSIFGALWRTCFLLLIASCSITLYGLILVGLSA